MTKKQTTKLYCENNLIVPITSKTKTLSFDNGIIKKIIQMEDKVKWSL